MPMEPSLSPVPNDLASLRVELASARAEADRFKALLGDLKEVVFQIDRQGQWAFLNPAWVELTGYSVEERLGCPFLDSLLPADNARYLNLLTYAVEDSGSGVPEADRERLFEPYFSTKRKGTGLGLAIVQEVALALGAEVKLGEPAQGTGLVVTLAFPRG